MAKKKVLSLTSNPIELKKKERNNNTELQINEIIESIAERKEKSDLLRYSTGKCPPPSIPSGTLVRRGLRGEKSCRSVDNLN